MENFTTTGRASSVRNPLSFRRLAISVLAVCASVTHQVTSAHRIHRTNFAPSAIQRFEHGFHPRSYAVGDPLRDHSAQALSTSTPSTAGFPYLTIASKKDPVKMATEFLVTRLGYLAETDFIVKDSYTDIHNGATHVYLKQIVHGREVTNGDANVNVDRFGRVVSYGTSFFKGAVPPKTDDSDEGEQPAAVQLMMDSGKDSSSGRSLSLHSSRSNRIGNSFAWRENTAAADDSL